MNCNPGSLVKSAVSGLSSNSAFATSAHAAPSTIIAPAIKKTSIPP